jgi:hypothetical protein
VWIIWCVWIIVVVWHVFLDSRLFLFSCNKIKSSLSHSFTRLLMITGGLFLFLSVFTFVVCQLTSPTTTPHVWLCGVVEFNTHTDENPRNTHIPRYYRLSVSTSVNGPHDKVCPTCGCWFFFLLVVKYFFCLLTLWNTPAFNFFHYDDCGIRFHRLIP